MEEERKNNPVQAVVFYVFFASLEIVRFQGFYFYLAL